MTALAAVDADKSASPVAGVLVVGFLPGCWQEEGYDGARRFALLGCDHGGRLEWLAAWVAALCGVAQA